MKTGFPAWLAVVAAGLPMSSCGGGSADEAPLVKTPMEAATVIDVRSTVVGTQNVAPAGTTIETAEATLVIPADALAAKTRVEMVRLDGPFNMNPYATDAEGAISAVPVGDAVDFGPAGVAFDSPVTITLPYDSAALTDRYSRPTLAYWTGTRWLLLDSAVDSDAHTVSVRLASFDGILVQAVVIAGTAAIWTYVAVKWAANDDPITEQRAKQYVTPDDANVTAAAAKASIGGVPLANKAELAQYLGSLSGGQARLSIQGDTGSARYFSYSAGTGANWQKPADFLSDSPTGDNYNGDKALGRLKGDCTDATNATVSMFRALGYPAKGVFGYVSDKDSPHAWAEVVIGGVPYIVDERGTIEKLDTAMIAQHLIRPDAGDNRNFMWDETGQVPYQQQWWTSTVSTISAITLVSGSLGSYRGFAVAQGLEDYGKINLDAAGKFSVAISQAKKSFVIWPDIQTTATMSDLAIKGQWDNAKQSGTVTLTANEHVMMVDWGQGKNGTQDGTYNRITEDYTFAYDASGTIELADDSMKFVLQTEWTRTGTKTESRVVVSDGQATVSGTPVVTDMARTSTSSGEFWFSY